MASDPQDRATVTERDREVAEEWTRDCPVCEGMEGYLAAKIAQYRADACVEAVREERERRVQAEKKLRAATAFGEVEERLRKEAEATIKSLAYMLGWENVPPRESLERNILENRKRLERAEKEWDRFKAATQTSRELAAEQGINVLKVKLLEAEARIKALTEELAAWKDAAKAVATATLGACVLRPDKRATRG